MHAWVQQPVAAVLVRCVEKMASMHPFSIAALLGLSSHEEEEYESDGRTDSETGVSGEAGCHGGNGMAGTQEKASVCHSWSRQAIPLLWYPWMNAGTCKQGRKRSVGK